MHRKVAVKKGKGKKVVYKNIIPTAPWELTGFTSDEQSVLRDLYGIPWGYLTDEISVLNAHWS